MSWKTLPGSSHCGGLHTTLLSLELLISISLARLVSVETGEEVLNRAVEIQPTLILMDLRLPGIDGLESTQLLKRDPRTKDIPVWAITACAMNGDEERARAAGCCEYITKPVRALDISQPAPRLFGPTETTRGGDMDQPTIRHIPVIMVTALNMDSQISLCLDGGAIDHIVKPFSGLVVRARVRAALRNHPSASAENQALKPGKVIGFIGAEGGAGTTTTAVNVALALSRRKDQSPSSRCGPTWARWPSSSVSPRR